MEPEQLGEAIRAFRAEKCPACGGKKGHLNDAFCEDCLNCLPDDLRERLSAAKTFIDAFHPAMSCIKQARTELNRPAGRPQRSGAA